MPSKEQVSPTLIHGVLMREPSNYQQKKMNPFPIFDFPIHGGDCMTSGRELSHWDCAHGTTIRFPYGLDSWRFFSCMDWMGRYIHVADLSSCIHRMGNATVHHRNKLAQEYVQILLNLRMEVLGRKGSDGLPIWFWDPSSYWDYNLPNVEEEFGSLQKRKWDLGIFLSDKLCWNEFSLNGV